ncbi:DUF2256 domain-containing protein [bacterium]|nr:DUF2256 domain-containing protein [bacterium]
MAGNRKKRDFPTKICPVCERPFVWRKKWARVWEQVKYCSAACRNNRSGDRKGDSDADDLLNADRMLPSDQ